MKPRGLNSLLSKQTNNFPKSTGPATPASGGGGINWNAPPTDGAPGAEKHEKTKTAHGKVGKGPTAKPSSGGSKNSASVPRRTAPGA